MVAERINKAELAERLVRSERRLVEFENDTTGKYGFLIENEKDVLRRTLDRLPENEETYALLSHAARYVDLCDARKAALDHSILGRLGDRAMMLSYVRDTGDQQNLTLGGDDSVLEEAWAKLAKALPTEARNDFFPGS